MKLSLHNLVLDLAYRVQKKYKWFKIGDLLNNHHTVLQWVEFGIVGGLGVLTNYGFYFMFRNMVHNDIAWLIGILVSFTQNFFLSKWLVFESDFEQKLVKEI